MKNVYNALNTIDAHLMLDLLQQAGISARIVGEHLQGGVGELLTMNYIRVVVAEPDYEEAREIVEDWDAR